MAKLHFLLVLICLAQVCFSAPTLTTTKNDKPGTAVDKTADSDEMTMTPEQMAEMKKQLMEDLPEEDAQIITDIFKQMSAESTQEEKTDGAMKMTMLAMAMMSSKTSAEMHTMIQSMKPMTPKKMN